MDGFESPSKRFEAQVKKKLKLKAMDSNLERYIWFPYEKQVKRMLTGFESLDIEL